jgi:hypothetical protein
MPRNLLKQSRVVGQVNRVVLKLDYASQRPLSRDPQVAVLLIAVAIQTPQRAEPALVKVLQKGVKTQEDHRSYLCPSTEKSTLGQGPVGQPAGL